MTEDAAISTAAALQMQGITKRYPGVVANDHIDLDLRRGEIHALLGENGAGKTTLMNVLYGLARPDEGRILMDGQPVEIAGPVRRDRPRNQHGSPAFHAGPGSDRGRERHPRRRDHGQPRLRRPARGEPGGSANWPAIRLRPGPGRQGRIPLGRAAAAGRDPEGALPRGPNPGPRRADGRADAAGDRGDLRRCCAGWPPTAGRSSSSATSSTRSSTSPTGSPSSGAAE